MCGIYGLFHTQENVKLYDERKVILRTLALESERRGKDAAGIAAYTGNDVVTLKFPLRAKDLLQTPEFRGLEPILQSAQVVLGHSRLATNGSIHNPENNQPLFYKGLLLVHNGIITNAADLSSTQYASDSFAFLHTLVEHAESHSLQQAVSIVLPMIEGSASVAVVDCREGKPLELILATNTGSLYYAPCHADSMIAFGSEAEMLRKIPTIGQIQQIKARECVSWIVGENQKAVGYKVNTAPFSVSKRVINSLAQLKKHTIDFDQIAHITRCTHCILPATTPFIYFDSQGICNYCHEHVPFSQKGTAVLHEIVDQHRSTDGSVDCIVALSGGRDSSYGLHYAVKELGLHPVAFTYDWGMVSDIGRRNQARMVGKLGVEHVVVAADIKNARRHIRMNIEAWMKKPDLGMIPLFMQGDKTAEYHVDRLKKQLGIKLVLFCRGNEYEREEFKAGYCGIHQADPGGVIHHLPVMDKLKLLFYYGSRYLQNPNYINASLFSTLQGYLTTYLIPHDYEYLWHYIPWDEQTILTTLTSQYDWEGAPDSAATWRIDDGSPAFYNYIYCRVQGFTEHDSFRSHQIRQGDITRTQALELVFQENQPRYEALQWYFNAIGMDGHDVLQVIDRIPLLY